MKMNKINPIMKIKMKTLILNPKINFYQILMKIKIIF